MNRKGLPAVVLVTKRFEPLARSVANARGIPSLPMVVLPPTEVTEYSSPQETRRLGQQVCEQVLEALGIKS